MRKGTVSFFMVLSCGAFLAGGCAKKEMVKGEQPVSPTTSATETAPKTPATDEKMPREQQQPRTGGAATIKEEPLQETARTEQEAAIEKVYFDYDAYTLSPAARETLKKDADYLKKKVPGKVQIEGHCDERGSDEYNLALGEKRARAVFNYLVTLGLPAERLAVISYGKEKPAEQGHDEAAWAKNRRAEFTLLK